MSPGARGRGHRAPREIPFCAIEDELRAADEMVIHPLPEGQRERRGPFGVSTAFHLVLIVVLILQTKWAPRPQQRPKPDLTIEFKDPLPEPSKAKPPARAAQPRPQPPAPKPEPKPIAPPVVPKEIPPQQPLPPPKRMGEPEPVPHLPVPGTVPPEDRKTGKPGPPTEQKEPPKVLPGDENGANETDSGFGKDGGPGAGERDGMRDAADGSGVVAGGPTGSVTVPRLKGGVPGAPGSGGGGRRRGLNLELPPESGAFGDFTFDDKDYDWNDYYSQMYWSIWRAWHNRLYVMTPIFERWSVQHRVAQLKGSVLIRFVIQRSGAVTSIEVLDPSNMPPLDDSAQSALKEVILPRLPDDFPKDSEGVTGRFLMEIPDVPSFKEGLRYMKYRGVF